MTNHRHLALAILTAAMLIGITAEAAPPASKGSAAQPAAATVIDLNTASAAELMKLPNGI